MDTKKTELRTKICDTTKATFSENELSNLIEKVRQSFEAQKETMIYFSIQIEKDNVKITTENITKKTILGNLECYIFNTTLFYCEPNFEKKESSIIRNVVDRVERIKSILGIE